MFVKAIFCFFPASFPEFYNLAFYLRIWYTFAIPVRRTVITICLCLSLSSSVTPFTIHPTGFRRSLPDSGTPRQKTGTILQSISTAWHHRPAAAGAGHSGHRDEQLPEKSYFRGSAAAAGGNPGYSFRRGRRPLWLRHLLRGVGFGAGHDPDGKVSAVPMTGSGSLWQGSGPRPETIWRFWEPAVAAADRFGYPISPQSIFLWENQLDESLNAFFQCSYSEECEDGWQLYRDWIRILAVSPLQ